MIKNLTIGSDPEFFINNFDGSLASSIGNIGGSKRTPLPLKYSSVLEDNVTVEFNPIPGNSANAFVENHMSALSELDDFLSERGFVRRNEAALEFPEYLLNSPHARISGCEPDYSAFTKAANRSIDYKLTNLRAAAGHIHIGWNGIESKKDKEDFIIGCEVLLSVPMAMKASEDDRVRRHLYGKCGSFRPKPYGVEFRTPSSKWIHNEARMNWVWRQIERVCEQYKEISEYIWSDEDIAYDLFCSVNDCDVSQILPVVKQFGLEEFPNV